MSVRVKQLNGDTSFLLTFHAPDERGTAGSASRPLTVLTDPWLIGPSTVLSPKLAVTQHTLTPCVASLAELPDPDFIIISLEKTDHCNERTLRQLPPTSRATILAPPKAVKKIQSWRHFDPKRIHALSQYDSGKDSSVFRATLPSVLPDGVAGELTVALMSTRLDMSGLHNAVGITYRPPVERTQAEPPPNLPDSPNTPQAIDTVDTARHNVPRTLSIIYSPHGVPFDTLRSYATSHLVAEMALPVSLLLHCFDHVQNTWYLGGNISSGSPAGVEIARNLSVRTWIGAHDEEKLNKGMLVTRLVTTKFKIETIRSMLETAMADDARVSLTLLVLK